MQTPPSCSSGGEGRKRHPGCRSNLTGQPECRVGLALGPLAHYGSALAGYRKAYWRGVFYRTGRLTQSVEPSEGENSTVRDRITAQRPPRTVVLMSARAADAAVRTDIAALSRLDREARLSPWQTIQRGVARSPEVRQGLG